MKNIITPLLVIVCIIIMLCSPHTSVEGASYGISLWFNSVLPALLPFMIATNIIVRLNIMDTVNAILTGKFKRKIKLPVCILYIIFTGLLCGFPMGAKVINDFYNNNDISAEEASWLIAFCNLPSPVFLISYTASKSLRSDNIILFAACFYLPLLIIIPLSYCFYVKKHGRSGNFYLPKENKSDAHKEHRFTISVLEQSMTDSYIAISKIGGYMIIFSIIAAFMKKISCISMILRAILICAAEMTTGISLLSSLNIPYSLKAAISLAALGIGGMSCTAQTAGVISNTKIKLGHYLVWRLVHAAFAVSLFIILNMI